MKTEKKNNGIEDYDFVTVDNEEDETLEDVVSGKEIGTSISLGYDFYDRKTGELLTTPRKMKISDIIEIKKPYEIDDKHVFTEGDIVSIKGQLYKVLVTHTINEENANNFDTFYELM